MKISTKTQIIAFTFVSLALMLGMAVNVQAAPTTAAITCPAEVRIGNLLSCKITGLTVGSNYIATAEHSDGNVSKVFTATTATEYARFTFTTADSDGIVPVDIGSATVAGALTGADIDTALVNLVSPADDIPSSFFQLLLAPLLIIGIFILLMGAFFIKKRMKT